MTDMFKIIELQEKVEEDKKGLYLCIDVKIADRETPCPLSNASHSYEDLAVEIAAIKNSLDQVLKNAREHNEDTSTQKEVEFSPDMTCEEIWAVLSGIAEDALFIRRFNSLDEHLRREVAEYVLTKCNIFSGKAAVFSSGYNNETGLID
jgi:hypothetical protein